MGNGRQKVTSAQVQEYLTGTKATIKDVAAKFVVTSATARKHVLGLVKNNVVIKEGVRPLGGRGRSPDLYTVGSTTGVVTPAPAASTVETPVTTTEAATTPAAA